MNIVLLEELSEKLFQLYKPYFGKNWKTKLALSTDMQLLYDDFFIKHPKYSRLKHLITIYFEILDIPIMSGVVWQLESIQLSQNI